jgi:hypothetical protein
MAKPLSETSATVRVAVPHWTPEDGSGGTAVRYMSLEGFQSPFDPGPASRGVVTWSTGPTATAAPSSRSLTWPLIAAAINTGQVHFELSGYLGGKADDTDTAVFYLEAFDSTANLLYTTAIGPVTAADRGNQTGLLFRQAGGVLPAGTDSLVLTLAFVRNNGVYDDGAADNLSLVLRLPPIICRCLCAEAVLRPLSTKKSPSP